MRATGLPAPHRRALAVITSRLRNQPITWALTGSTAFAVQGLPVTPHDIDLQTDTEGAYRIEALLEEYVREPVRLCAGSDIRSHFGRLEVDGVMVEVMGDIEHRRGDGSWSPPAPLPALIRQVEADGFAYPVLDLAYERDAYRLMGRHERAEMIERWLAKHPAPPPEA